MVKCLTHGSRGFNDAVQRRLATLTVTMLISSCWQLSSEVDLHHIFDVCKRWANSGSHESVKKIMVRYMRPHGRFAHCSCKNATRGFMLHFYTAEFLHLQCAYSPFWPLVSKYTIFEGTPRKKTSLGESLAESHAHNPIRDPARREFSREIFYENIAIIAIQHSKMSFVDTFGDFSHTVEWNSLKSVWKISLYILA